MQTDKHAYIATELSKNVAFVMVSVHRFRGLYKIPNATVEFANTTLKKDMVTNPRWDLIPKRWNEKFNTVESNIKSLIHSYCVENPEEKTEQNGTEAIRKFPLRGVHIIPKKSMFTFFDEVKKIEAIQFKPLVKSFGDDWKNIVTSLQLRTDDQPAAVWMTMAKHLPTSSVDVMNRFWIEKIIVPITIDSNVGLETLTGKEAEDYVQEIKSYGQQFTKQVTDMIVTGLEDELKNAVDNLTNRISEGGVIKSGTLDIVKTAFQKLQSFDFIMTDDLKKKMKAAQFVMGDATPKELNKDLKESGTSSITAKLSEHLKAVRDQCIADAAVARAHGRGRRNIKLVEG